MLPRWLSLLVVLVAVPPIVWTGGGSVTSCHHYKLLNEKQGWQIDKEPNEMQCASSPACYSLHPKPRVPEREKDQLNVLVIWFLAGKCWASDSLTVERDYSGLALLTGESSGDLVDGTSVKLELLESPDGCGDQARINKCTEETLQGTFQFKDTSTAKVKGTVTRTLPVILCCCDTNDCNSAQPTGYGQRYPAPSSPMQRPQLKCEKEPKFCGQPGDEGICVHQLDSGNDEFVCVTAKAKEDLAKKWQWCAVTEKVDWQPAKPFTNTLCRYDLKEEEGRVCCCAGPSCMAADLANLPERTTPTPTTTTVSGGTDALPPDSVTEGSVAPLCSGGKNTTEATKGDQSSLPLVIVGFALAGVLLLVVVVLVVVVLRCRQKVLALQKPAPETGLPVAAPVDPTATGGPPAAIAQVPPPAPAVADKAPETATAEDEPKSTGGDSESQRSNPLDARTDSGPGPSCSESSERSKAEGAAVRQPKDGGDQKATPK